MAGSGWINSTGSGIGTGRGAGGGGFPNRRYSGDGTHGASSSGGGGRWIGERSRGRPPSHSQPQPQPQYRYRPVDTAHRHSSTSAGPEQPAASTSTSTSTSTLHAQMSNQAAVTDKSPSSGTVAPASSNREPEDKGSRSAANFECNVCFDMAEEPVVTQCGHLFCWECLYQWLHVHSQDRECPVCKGQVGEDAIIPIYGRGGSAASVKNAPPRPAGARVESSRQQHHHQLHSMPHNMVYVDDDEEDSSFDFDSIRFGGSSLGDAFRSIMSPRFHDMVMDDQYDGYLYDYTPGISEVHHYNLTYMSDGHRSLSQFYADYIDLPDNVITVRHLDVGYSGAPHPHNRGRGRRYRARASADQSSTDAMVTGASYHEVRDNSANSNSSAGASSQPNGGWVERRGRSNRYYLAGGRGMRDGTRHRTNYS